MSDPQVNQVDNELFNMTTSEVNAEGPALSARNDQPGSPPNSPEEVQRSSHGSEGMFPLNGEEADSGRMRYKLLMQTLKVFDSKFSGSENIDEWFHRLEFFIRPHDLSTEEKAYLLVNSVKGKAFSVLTEGNSTNYEELKDILLKEFRAPGAYLKTIEDFCEAKQGRNQGTISDKVIRDVTASP
jgi:hypothetical protein